MRLISAVLVVGGDLPLDPIASQELAGDPSVLAGDEVGTGKGVQGAKVMSPRLPIGVPTI
jgi:hypothetical protein